MSASVVQSLLLWCALINYAVLMVWFVAYRFGHGWLYRLHSRWFPMSEPVFDAMNYGGMAVYKILVLVFNVVPLLAMLVVGVA